MSGVEFSGMVGGAIWFDRGGPAEGTLGGGGAIWGDGALLLCFDVGRGLGAMGRSSKKLPPLRSTGADALWAIVGPWAPWLEGGRELEAGGGPAVYMLVLLGMGGA